MNRRGFSLIEVIAALVISGIIGIALTRLVLSQARFVAGQEGTMRARAGARAGFNVMLSELRMVTSGGVTAATPDSITVRVPYAYGLSCIQPPGGKTAVALFPVDSATYASATISGYAWRDSTATMRFVEPATVTTGVASDCSTAAPAVTVLTWGRIVRVAPNNVATTPGLVVYLYRNIRYALAPSADIPGRRALWRTLVDTGAREELVTPFDTATTFSFLTGNQLAVQSAVPAVLDSIRGVRVKLVGLSETTPEGRSAPSSFTLSTDIVFINRAR